MSLRNHTTPSVDKMEDLGKVLLLSDRSSVLLDSLAKWIGTFGRLIGVVGCLRA